jgi:hypothetical protein
MSVRESQASPTETATPKRRGRQKGQKGTVRIHSLRGALGDAARCDEVYRWLCAENLSFADCAQRINDRFRLHTTPRAVGYFYGLYAFAEKVEDAKFQANQEKGLLPEDWQMTIREALAQRKFCAVLKELSDQQIVAYEKLEIEQQKVDLKNAQVFLIEQRQKLLERQKKEPPAARNTAIPPEEEAQRIRKILGRE